MKKEYKDRLIVRNNIKIIIKIGKRKEEKSWKEEKVCRNERTRYRNTKYKPKEILPQPQRHQRSCFLSETSDPNWLFLPRRDECERAKESSVANNLLPQHQQKV